jgi:tungstate transport system substrate-binding protein
VVEAFRKIADEKAPFISRGDRSGTNEAELRYWKDASIAVNPAQDRWYREIGQGMGPALNMAASAKAYVLSDRGTWLSFKNRGTLEILVEGDKRLFNQYGVMLVNPTKHPEVNAAAYRNETPPRVRPRGQVRFAAPSGPEEQGYLWASGGLS